METISIKRFNTSINDLFNKPLNFNGKSNGNGFVTRLGLPVRIQAYDAINNKYLVKVIKGYNLDYEYKVNADGSRYAADYPHFEDVLVA